MPRCFHCGVSNSPNATRCSACGEDPSQAITCLAGEDRSSSTGYAVHIDGTGDLSGMQPVLDKMAGLLRKKELIRTGNAGVDANGVIVDMRENPKAVRLPPHNAALTDAGGKERKV